MLALSNSSIYTLPLMAWTLILGMAHVKPDEIQIAIWEQF